MCLRVVLRVCILCTFTCTCPCARVVPACVRLCARVTIPPPLTMPMLMHMIAYVRPRAPARLGPVRLHGGSPCGGVGRWVMPPDGDLILRGPGLSVPPARLSRLRRSARERFREVCAYRPRGPLSPPLSGPLREGTCGEGRCGVWRARAEGVPRSSAVDTLAARVRSSGCVCRPRAGVARAGSRDRVSMFSDCPCDPVGRTILRR